MVIWAKPDFNIDRGSFALTALEIRAVGLGELLARLERLRRELAAEGLFAASAQAAAAVPARRGRADLRPRLGGRAGRARERGPALARGPVPGGERRRAGRLRGGRGHRRAAAAGRRPGRRGDHHRPGRRVGGGPAAVLRRVADPRGRGQPDPGGQRDRARAGRAAARPGRRRARVDADRRGPPGRAGRVRAAGADRRSCGPGRGGALAGQLDRELSWLAGVRSRPVLAGPARDIERRQEQVEALVLRARRCLAAGWTGPATTSRTPGPGCWPCPRPPRCAAATRSCSAATAPSCGPRPRSATARRSASGSPRTS